MPRGENLKRGSLDGDRGRMKGSSLGGQSTARKPAPADCERCRLLGYTSWMQHIGHLGFRAVLHDYPEALHSLRPKIKRTGRASSRARWKQLSS
jgi:hypothetical protein